MAKAMIWICDRCGTEHRGIAGRDPPVGVPAGWGQVIYSDRVLCAENRRTLCSMCLQGLGEWMEAGNDHPQ